MPFTTDYEKTKIFNRKISEMLLSKVETLKTLSHKKLERKAL